MHQVLSVKKNWIQDVWYRPAINEHAKSLISKINSAPTFFIARYAMHGECVVCVVVTTADTVCLFINTHWLPQSGIKPLAVSNLKHTTQHTLLLRYRLYSVMVFCQFFECTSIVLDPRAACRSSQLMRLYSWEVFLFIRLSY